jgi:hypothetical protein
MPDRSIDGRYEGSQRLVRVYTRQTDTSSLSQSDRAQNDYALSWEDDAILGGHVVITTVSDIAGAQSNPVGST